MVVDLKNAFAQGRQRSKLTSHRQALTRAAFDGFLITILIWGPYMWWLRLLVCLIARFVYGIFASSDRFHRWL